MFARATSLSVASHAVHFNALHSSNILRLQQQISSGLRVTRPSDSPGEYQQISALNSQLSSLSSSLSVIQSASSRLNASVSELQEVNRLISTVTQLAQQGVQSAGASERAALATEVEGLAEQMKNLANSKFGQHYLFGGTRAGSEPFQFGGPAAAGQLAATQYSGGGQNSQSVISPSLAVDSLYDGSQIFHVAGRQPTVVISTTGVTRGDGTDSMTGRANLQIRHTLSTYAPGSGVAAGSGSPGGDTILGPAGRHQLTITDTSGTGTAGTVSLNGGKPVAFDSSQANLSVTNDSGETVYLDMTAITAGFSGTVDITATGTLSVDGGVTTTAIDFSGSQAVTDGATGKVVRLNTSAVNRSGDDYLEFPGTTDIFETLDALVRDLRGERSLDNSSVGDSLGRILDRLEQIGNQVLETMGIQSSTLAGLEQLQFRNEDLRLEFETERAQLQATDLPTAIIDLQSQQLLQQYTFSVTSQVMSQSLINFLS